MRYFAFLALLLLLGCKKGEQGPQGEKGETGPPGAAVSYTQETYTISPNQWVWEQANNRYVRDVTPTISVTGIRSVVGYYQAGTILEPLPKSFPMGGILSYQFNSDPYFSALKMIYYSSDNTQPNLPTTEVKVTLDYFK